MVQVQYRIFGIVLCFIRANAYPSGAPSMACQDMKPAHPPTTTTGTPPFKVNLTEKAYTTGSEITGVLYSPSGVKFRGFLIEVRSSSNNSSTAPFGEFINIGNDSQTVQGCGQNNKQALTHTSNTNKTQLQFTWLNPTTTSGDIHFKVTVVEAYSPSRYWMGIYSEVVEDCAIHNSSACKSLPTVKPISPTSSNRPSTSGKSSSSGTHTPSSTQTPAPETSTNPNNGIQNDPDCGVTKGCFPDCGDTCEYLVKWQAGSSNGGDSINFDIQMKLASMENIWIAIGFSPDGKMADTNVAACLSQPTGLSMQSSYNDGYSNVILNETEKTIGLSVADASISNGVFSCKFSREKRMNLTHFADLKEDYFLLVGTGPVSGDIIRQHSSIPVSSSNKLNFSEFSVAQEDESVGIMIKLHASLMVVAWVFLSSVGIVSARHCKGMLASKLLFKLKVWFVVHRTCMALVMVCVIAAFVIIFYEKGGFQEITAVTGKEYTKAHPYMGIVVTAFTVLNPLMALFRPAPDSEKRYIFNWAHFAVGTSAHILAVVTIFFGLDLDAAKVNKNAFYVMVTYAATFVVVQTVLECYNYQRKQPKGRGMHTLNDHQSKIHMNERSNFSVYMLGFHFLLMFLVAGFLVAMICMPSQFNDWFGK